MIKLKLKEVLHERGILHPHTWLLNVLNLSSSTADRLLKGNIESISMKYLDVICQQVDCTPNDLLYYVRDGRQKLLPPEHSLYTLKAPENITDWNKLFAKIPPQQVAETSKKLNEILKKGKKQ